MDSNNDLLREVMACIIYLHACVYKYIHVFKQAGGNKAEGLKTQPSTTVCRGIFIYRVLGASEAQGKEMMRPWRGQSNSALDASLATRNRFFPHKKNNILYYTDCIRELTPLHTLSFGCILFHLFLFSSLRAGRLKKMRLMLMGDASALIIWYLIHFRLGWDEVTYLSKCSFVAPGK